MTIYNVAYRYYATDDTHHHWCDDIQQFDTESAALDFIAELDSRIADGDTYVSAGRLVSTNRPSRTSGYRSDNDPFTQL